MTPTQQQPTTQATITGITWTVPSATQTGVEYRVCAINPTGLLTCSCRAGQFGKMCRHVRSVVKGQAGRPRVRVTIHTQPAPERDLFAERADAFERVWSARKAAQEQACVVCCVAVPCRESRTGCAQRMGVGS